MLGSYISFVSPTCCMHVGSPGYPLVLHLGQFTSLSLLSQCVFMYKTSFAVSCFIFRSFDRNNPHNVLLVILSPMHRLRGFLDKYNLSRHSLLFPIGGPRSFLLGKRFFGHRSQLGAGNGPPLSCLPYSYMFLFCIMGNLQGCSFRTLSYLPGLKLSRILIHKAYSKT